MSDAIVPMPAPLPLFARALAGFALMHLAVLGVVTLLRGGRGARVVRWSAALRYGVEFVVAEAAMLTAALHTGLVRLAPLSLPKTLALLVLAAPWWELWFYLGHRLLHTRALYRFHRPHHADAGVHLALRFGAVETVMLSAGFYVPLVLASRVDAVSAPALAGIFALSFALNVLTHLDDDAVSRFIEGRPLRHVLNAPAYHALHHDGARGNYGLNTPWFDRLFGTALTSERPARGAAHRPPRASTPRRASAPSPTP